MLENEQAGGDCGTATFIHPSPAMLALWELEDARDGEPVDRAALQELAAQYLSDFELVEYVARCEQAASRARARELIAVHVLAGRKSMNPSWPVSVGTPCIAGEEIAIRLGVSRTTGRELVEAAELFAGPLMATADALESGDIDWGKARIVIGALRNTPIPVVLDVQDQVLPEAGRRTHAQLRTDLQRALIAVDPIDAEQRATRAVDERRVCHPKVLPDGMSGLWAVLPAQVAAAIDAALNGAARTAKLAGDPRTIDQLRADAYAGALVPGVIPGLGLPGLLAGSCRSGSVGVGAGAASTGVGAGPCRAGTSQSGAAFGLAAPVGTPQLSGLARIDVTVALTTLLGLDELHGELAGYGAITAQTARRLAATGTWRRLVTDPLTGTVLDVGRRRHDPPGDLAEIIRARDRHCLSPICQVDSRGCDLDHRVPFGPDGTGGATSAENVAPLCRRDHLLKTHAGWRLERDTDATFTWTTPTGHTYPYRSEPPPGHEPELDLPPLFDDPPF